uniref:BPTI/Kunitz inhibitor domain-containing protein n=1 Tax=Plectus sambesii TaxID=2011161 RepID=A0A914VEC4_9BILA
MKSLCIAALLTICSIAYVKAQCREPLKPRYLFDGCDWNIESGSDGCDAYAAKCDDSTDRTCFQKQDPGTGSETHLRYYFDARYNRCFPLFYSGKGGNKNNFGSREACAQACHPVFTDTVLDAAAGSD